MTDKEILESEKLRTYELVGRNVLLFQQMEGLLKSLLPAASLEGRDATGLTTKHQKKRANIEGQTLGRLVNDFIDELMVTEAESADKDRATPGVAISFRLVFKSEKEMKERQQRLIDLVADRNHLVHHFHSDLDHDNLESWRSARSSLKALRSRTQNEIEALRKLAQSRKTFSEALSHPVVRSELTRPR
ncbi:MAG: hypothetical protein P1U86_16710 [Verrucomicrobiales bacterium]|nr:hypothetical protein [Verrucomicrobiales bacterium]